MKKIVAIVYICFLPYFGYCQNKLNFSILPSILKFENIEDTRNSIHVGVGMVLQKKVNKKIELIEKFSITHSLTNLNKTAFVYYFRLGVGYKVDSLNCIEGFLGRASFIGGTNDNMNSSKKYSNFLVGASYIRSINHNKLIIELAYHWDKFYMLNIGYAIPVKLINAHLNSLFK